MAASFSLFFLSAWHQLALADDSVSVALNRPSAMTPTAQYGLFTSLARAGNRVIAVGEHGRVMLSDDSGNSWRQIETPSSVTLTKVVFISPREGWVLGQMGLVLHTIDGGEHWQMQLDGIQANLLTLRAAQMAISVQGKNEATSADLTAAEAMVAGGPSVPFLAFLAISSTNLLITGGYGLAMTSADGGNSWRSIADQLSNPNGLHLYAIASIGNRIFIAGEQGLLLSGPAAGPFNTVATPFQGSFFGALVTPAHALILFGLQGTILRSADQGKTWQRLPSGVSDGIDAGAVLRDSSLVLGDLAGNLLLSRDDGKTFHLTAVGEPVTAAVQAANGNIIVAGPFGIRSIVYSSHLGE